jgi:histidinol-phosphate aminotransferase
MRCNKKLTGKQGYFLPRGADSRFVNLAVIENNEPPSPAVVAKVAELCSAADGLSKYPSGDGGFEEAALRYAGAPEGCRVIPTHGSDNGLKLICDTFIEVDSKVMWPTPTYPHMEHFISCSKTDVSPAKVPVAMGVSGSDAAELILAALAAEKPDLCYIVNPNMPLGYELPVDMIRRMVAEHPGTLFIIDEAYLEYGETPSATGLCSSPNVIVTRTFSKAFGLASARIGYLVCDQSNYELLRVLYNEKDVTALSMQLARAALTDVQHYRNCVDRTLTIKELFSRGVSSFARSGRLVHGIYAAAGNFVFLLCEDPLRVVDLLRGHRFLVRNKHPEIPGGVRVSIGTQGQMDRLLFHLHVAAAPEDFAWVFDLDGVLRRGSRRGDRLDLAVVPRGIRGLTLVTNNTSQGGEELAALFEEAGIHLNQVITPVQMLNEALGGRACRVYLVGTAHGLSPNITVVRREDWRGAEALVMLNDFYRMSPEQWAEVVELSKTVPWFLAEDTFSTELRLCAESGACADPTDEHLVIPDLGGFGRLLQGMGAPAPRVLGKPNVPRQSLAALGLDVPVVYVGDSGTDVEQAARWGVHYLDVRDVAARDVHATGPEEA